MSVLIVVLWGPLGPETNPEGPNKSDVVSGKIRDWITVLVANAKLSQESQEFAGFESPPADFHCAERCQ